MMRRAWLCLAFALATPQARAASQDFGLVNRTGFEIESLYLREAGADRWGNNVLGIESLGPGGRVHVAFARSEQGCGWDLMVRYRNEDTAVWPHVDLCAIRTIALFWDRVTGLTVAKAE